MAPTANGRSPTGQFLIGNPGGPGNPHASKVSRLRSALLAAVSESDIADVIAALLERAKAGDTKAAQIVLDRTLGKPNAVISARVRAERPAPMQGLTAGNISEAKAAIALRIQRLIEHQAD